MITDIKITNAVSDDNSFMEANGTGYYVNIDYMYGDADEYNDQMVGCFTEDDKAYLLDFINILDRCLEAFPDGRRGNDNYEDHIPELKIWLGNEKTDDPKLADCIDRIAFEWEIDPDGWGDEATIEGYAITYYDATKKTAYNVSLT